MQRASARERPEDARTDRLAHDARRSRMVRLQLEERGVRSREVLAAMSRVRREDYVPAELAEQAYDDSPLPIGEGQTISQPYIVAYMLEALALHGGERVLEVGTGSGYAAAVLAELGCQVYTIERHGSLAHAAAQRLWRHGYAGVHVRHGDGTLGWPSAAPFDAVLVAAGAAAVPPALLEQLGPAGRLVMPVGVALGAQRLVRITRAETGAFDEEQLARVRFVPLVGAATPGSPAPPGCTGRRR